MAGNWGVGVVGFLGLGWAVLCCFFGGSQGASI